MAHIHWKLAASVAPGTDISTHVCGYLNRLFFISMLPQMRRDYLSDSIKTYEYADNSYAWWCYDCGPSMDNTDDNQCVYEDGVWKNRCLLCALLAHTVESDIVYSAIGKCDRCSGDIMQYNAHESVLHGEFWCGECVYEATWSDPIV